MRVSLGCFVVCLFACFDFFPLASDKSKWWQQTEGNSSRWYLLVVHLFFPSPLRPLVLLGLEASCKPRGTIDSVTGHGPRESDAWPFRLALWLPLLSLSSLVTTVYAPAALPGLWKLLLYLSWQPAGFCPVAPRTCHCCALCHGQDPSGSQSSRSPWLCHSLLVVNQLALCCFCSSLPCSAERKQMAPYPKQASKTPKITRREVLLLVLILEHEGRQSG